MCTLILPAYLSVHHLHAWYPQRSEQSVGSPGTGVTDGQVGVGIGIRSAGSSLCS